MTDIDKYKALREAGYDQEIKYGQLFYKLSENVQQPDCSLCLCDVRLGYSASDERIAIPIVPNLMEWMWDNYGPVILKTITGVYDAVCYVRQKQYLGHGSTALDALFDLLKKIGVIE